MYSLLAWLTWNPVREAFIVPILDRPVTWYGILFASGVAFCYIMLIYIFKIQIWRKGNISKIWIKNWPKFLAQFNDDPSFSNTDDRVEIIKTLNHYLENPNHSTSRKERFEKLHKKFPQTLMTPYEASFYLIDRLLWYGILGTLIGARLGHVFFYDLARYMQNPMEIFMVWNGGVASHGAAIGILLAIYLFYLRYRDSLPGKGYFAFLDLFIIPIPIAGVCIRLGNFFNQEILGTPSTLPWAVIFANPIDGRSVVPRHPVMLYEAAACIAIFFILFSLWKTRGSYLRAGFLSGLFFTLIFGARFILEFFKVLQTNVVIIEGIRMGQILSVPFILLGLILIWRSTRVSGRRVCADTKP